MKIKIKTIYNGLASVRDYQIKNREDLELEYQGKTMVIKSDEVKNKIVRVPMSDYIYHSKFNGQEYKMVYFNWI